MNKYIFKCFKTKNGNYVYDRSTNSILTISEDEYNELKEVSQEKISPENSRVLLKYQNLGAFKENIVKEIEHPATEYLEHYASNRVGQLTLQVTQQCNLRCSYCAYSGVYEGNRVHSNKRMDFSTAKKAIDYFVKNSKEKNEIHLSFYGGEPLLEFDLIKQCIAYIKLIVQGKKITFGMTTNGTLLTDEVVTFLKENNINITISLDGSKDEHDINRKFKSGEGSFDVIMTNVKRIIEQYPEYGKSIHFNTVINPQSNLGCVLEYFDSNTLLSDNYIMFSQVEPNGYMGSLKYEEKFYLLRKYEYLKFILMMIGKLDEKYVSKLVISSKEQYKRYYQRLKRHEVTTRKAHHGGPCIPGTRRLFVSVDGNFYPCEKVSETNNFFCMGSVDKGHNIEKMKSILNIGKITEEECKECWNLVNCTICSGQVEIKEHICDICKEDKMKQCASEKARVISDMYELCILQEFGCNMLKENII